MRVRSHKYSESTENYTDTTYYDKDDKYLDIGYQRLKMIDIKLYPQMAILTKLFIDHNNLENLPEPSQIPNIEYLTCAVNKLKNIPFYPKLTFLDMSYNQFLKCNSYHNSSLTYLDCSHNPGFIIDFTLPVCDQLYITNNDMQSINLDLFPKLTILDCGNNKLTKIAGGNNLVEINIQYNQIKELPSWPTILRIQADYNQIEELKTYETLISLNISYNKLKKIEKQPLLKTIIANNNNISQLGELPGIETADLCHNEINSFVMPDKVKYLSLQFNPITKLELKPDIFKIIKELQLNFDTYKYIYQNYYQYIEHVDVRISGEKWEELAQKLKTVFEDNIISYISCKFNGIKFNDREKILRKIALKIYWKYFPKKDIKDVKELIESKEYKHLLDTVSKLYYKTIIIVLYFNGHF